MKSLLVAIAFAAVLSAFTHVQAIDLGKFALFEQAPEAEKSKVVR